MLGRPESCAAHRELIVCALCVCVCMRVRWCVRTVPRKENSEQRLLAVVLPAGLQHRSGWRAGELDAQRQVVHIVLFGGCAGMLAPHTAV